MPVTPAYCNALGPSLETIDISTTAQANALIRLSIVKRHADTLP